MRHVNCRIAILSLSKIIPSSELHATEAANWVVVTINQRGERGTFGRRGGTSDRLATCAFVLGALVLVK